MNTGSPFQRRNRTWVQETDDYLEQGKTPEGREPQEPTGHV